MTDLSPAYIQMLKDRANGTPLEGMGFILPSYDGYGISSLPATISHWLGGPEVPGTLLAPEILECFQARYKRVVLLLVDALGYNQLVRLMGQGKAPFWTEAEKDGLFLALTSVSPSTTSSALTTLWTGTNPAQHGVIGYEMWLKELSMVINTILHMPISYTNDMGSLAKGGFIPATFTGQSHFGNLLGEAGIEAHAFMPSHIAGSGLSLMQMEGVHVHGYAAESDLWLNLCRELNSRPADPKYIYAYWSLVDTLMHRYGTNDESLDSQFALFSQALKQNLIDKLEDWLREDTLFLMTADHGSIPTPYYEEYNLYNHPDLRDMLVMNPTCEGRLPSLYIKPGMEQSVRQYFGAAWPDKFTLLSKQEVLDLQLFGPGTPNPGFLDRIGDLLAVSHGDAYLWWPAKVNKMLGRHGALHPDEMLVPLFSVNLKSN